MTSFPSDEIGLSLGPVHADDESTDTALDIGPVQELVVSLIKTIQAFRMYPASNPMPQGFFEALWGKLSAFLEQHDGITLSVEERGLCFNGEVVYTGREVETNVAFLLYRDGVRGIRLSSGLEREELAQLVHVFVQGEDANRLEDDYVTLLWESDFRHISYVAIDQYLDENQVMDANALFRQATATEQLMPTHDGDVEEILEPRETETEAAPEEAMTEPDGPPPPGSQAAPAQEEERFLRMGTATLIELTDEEKIRLATDVENEVALDYDTRVVQMQLALLTLPEADAGWKQVLASLDHVVGTLVERKEFQRAAEVLEGVRQVAGTPELPEWKIAPLEAFADEAATTDRLAQIHAYIMADERRLTTAIPLLEHLGATAVPPLVTLLGELRTADARRLLCNLLVDIGANAPERFYPFLGDSKWYLVRNIVNILGRIGKVESVPYVEAAYQVDNIRVKREVIQALGTIAAGTSTSLLIRALDHDDASLRSLAAIMMMKAGGAAAFQHLLEVAMSHGFRDRDPSEIDAFFLGIGSGRSNAALPCLTHHLQTGGWWFQHRKAALLHTGAATALGMIGTPEALAILQHGAASRIESVRSACNRVLRERVG